MPAAAPHLGAARGRRVIVGATTATTTHLAGAQVVAASWRRLHPGAPFYVLRADADRATHGEPEPFVLFPQDLGLDAAELAIRRAIYSPFEYTTSLKPVLLRTLLDRGADAVVFTDCDTDLYAPLDELAALAAARGVALTPHVLRPLPADGCSPDELDLLQLGVYNTGLLAVGPSGAGFLDWWTGRLRRDCLDAAGEGFFVEQRWADLIPSYFDCALVRDPSVNVAFWNLHERALTFDGGRHLVDGRPLRHFHFSGFDPERPDVLGHAMARPPRVRRSDEPALGRLLDDYARALLGAGHRERRSGGYPFATDAAGRLLGVRERRLLREEVLRFEAGIGPPPPDPFDSAQSTAFARLVADRLGARLRRTVNRRGSSAAQPPVQASEWVSAGMPGWARR